MVVRRGRRGGVWGGRRAVSGEMLGGSGGCVEELCGLIRTSSYRV